MRFRSTYRNDGEHGQFKRRYLSRESEFWNLSPREKIAIDKRVQSGTVAQSLCLLPQFGHVGETT